jgi:hypothetical protein
VSKRTRIDKGDDHAPSMDGAFFEITALTALIVLGVLLIFLV